MFGHRSPIGLFRIQLLADDGRWHVYCGGEDLGNHHRPSPALEELCGGHTDWPGGLDPSTLGLADDLSAWQSWPSR